VTEQELLGDVAGRTCVAMHVRFPNLGSIDVGVNDTNGPRGCILLQDAWLRIGSGMLTNARTLCVADGRQHRAVASYNYQTIYLCTKRCLPLAECGMSPWWRCPTSPWTTHPRLCTLKCTQVANSRYLRIRFPCIWHIVSASMESETTNARTGSWSIYGVEHFNQG
jgi:hypothetical protein